MKWINSRIKWGIFFTTVIAMYGDTTVIDIQTTSTQAILRIRTDQTGSCTMKVSAVNNFSGSYAPINDVNTSYFSGSDQCSRVGNIVNGNRYALVIGKRAAELAADGIHRYSRALQAVTRYYYSITIGSDTLTGEFTTGNIPLGNTRNDSRFDRLRPGEYAFPSIDFTSGGKSKTYIDPQTGVALRRAIGPGEVFPATNNRTFSSTTGGSGWSGLTWTGTGVGSNLYLRESNPSPAFSTIQSIDSVRLAATLSGSASSVQVCLTNDGVNCAGGWITQAITGTPTAYTIGTTTPILDAWRNSPNIPSNYIDMQPAVGTLTKSGTALTWTSGSLFNLHWSAGSRIILGSTDCTIASVTHEKTVVLSSSGCIADGSYSFTGRTWGFLLRSAGTGTVTVGTSPTWTTTTSGTALMGSYGSPRLCQTVKYNGGYLCSSADLILFWFGDDGTINPIGHYPAPTSGGLDNYACGTTLGVVWDRTVPGKSWCVGAKDGVQVIYSSQYSGDNSAHIIAENSFLPDATSTIRSNVIGLNAEVAAFTSALPSKFADFSTIYGWLIVGRQGDYLILNAYNVSQDSPAWHAVYSTITNKIVAATCTYCGRAGAPNRWGESHAVTVAGDNTWALLSSNSTLLYSSSVTAGTLTSSLSTCPSNTIEPSLAGQAQCSTITLDSDTPLYMGSSLFGTKWLLGDVANVMVGGSQDQECVRLLTNPTGHQYVVKRNHMPYAHCGTSFTDSKLNHSGALTFQVRASTYIEWWWDFINDPTAADTTGTYLREDPDSADCHEIYEMGIFVVGCLKDEYTFGVTLRNGLPDTDLFTNKVFQGNPDGAFEGSTYNVSANCNEHHPSLGQTEAPASEQRSILDMRPYICDGHASVDQMSHVTGYIYKLSVFGASDLQYRSQGFVAGNGIQPMVDVSPAILTNQSSDNYKYCVVVIAGDCYSGSLVGEVYFNVPFATTGYDTPERFVDYPLNTIHDINLTQNGQTLGNLMQIDGTRPSNFGEQTRRLSTAFAPYRVQSTYWNGRALPDNSRAYFQVDRLDGVRVEFMVADLPPWPITQSTNRGEFVPIPLSLSGVSGDTVRVRFGYAENGPPTSLYCHERQTVCATDASGALPFVWTDETQHWTTCDTRCTVTIPAISGRVLYYVVDRKNGTTTVSGGLETVLVQ